MIRLRFFFFFSSHRAHSYKVYSRHARISSLHYNVIKQSIHAFAYSRSVKCARAIQIYYNIIMAYICAMVNVILYIYKLHDRLAALVLLFLSLCSLSCVFVLFCLIFFQLVGARAFKTFAKQKKKI
jgi:hypothetical protein